MTSLLKDRNSLVLILIFFTFYSCVDVIYSQSDDRQFQEEINRHYLRKFDRSTKSNARTFGIPKVRFIYLVPSDKTINNEYVAAITDAALHMQDFFQKEMGDSYSFELNNPIVEIYQTPHSANWYSTNPPNEIPVPPQSLWYWSNVLTEGFAISGGGYYDPNNIWIYYIDADIGCGQSGGAPPGAGVALMPGHDLKGLTGQRYITIPGCIHSSEDPGGKYRWIGGLGHEIGHALGLNHPAGCNTTLPAPDHGCTGGTAAVNSIMFFGYNNYPNTYLLNTDVSILYTSGFFSQMDLRIPSVFDFDGDQIADFSYWDPSNGDWVIEKSSTSITSTGNFGIPGDVIVPGDYDGDDKTDLALWRPSVGSWYIIKSSNSSFLLKTYGISGDTPVPADYDGDLKTDFAIWRPSTGDWFIHRSASDTYLSYFNFGLSGDKPVPQDYNGDKRADIAVFRPNSISGLGTWYVYNDYLTYFHGSPSFSYTETQYGLHDDLVVPADYDGDGKVDLSLWRESTGVFYSLFTTTNSSQSLALGSPSDLPVSADYDGDNTSDFSVWRPSTGGYFVRESSTLSTYFKSFGGSGDRPVANAYVR